MAQSWEKIVYDRQKTSKKDLLKCPLKLFVKAKKIAEGHMLKCPFKVVYERQKTEKGQLLKCPLGLFVRDKNLKTDINVFLVFVRADAVAKPYRPGLQASGRGSTPPKSRAQVGCGIQIKFNAATGKFFLKALANQKN